MKSEMWWNAFALVYKEPLGLLDAATKAIMDNKYGYHIASGLYGETKAVEFSVGGKTIDIEEAKSQTQMIAAAAQGMILALAAAEENKLVSQFALSNARALVKAGAANPMLQIRVNTLIIKAIDMVSDTTDIASAISAALPELPTAGVMVRDGAAK
jgi:hypothetical protein